MWFVFNSIISHNDFEQTYQFIFLVTTMNTTVIRSVKLFPSVLSAQRNFGVCSVLMVNKAPTDPIQKLFLDKLKEYNRLSG